MLDDETATTPQRPLRVERALASAEREAWVVLGMHRSGTSAMARVLELSGGRMPNDLLPSNEANALGYWESASVLELNRAILATADSEWDDAFSGRPRPYLSHFDQSFRRRAADVVRAAFGADGPIVLKDPRINVLAAFWDTVLKAQGFRPCYLIMVRHPAEVAASLLARDHMPVEHGLILWLDHMIAAERDTRDAPRAFVSYDALLEDWRGVLDRVEEAWGHPLPRRTGVSGAEIARALRPGLRHHTAGKGTVETRSEAAVIAQDAYGWFKESAGAQPPTDCGPLVRAAAWLQTLHEQVEPVLTYQKLHLGEVRAELKRYMAHAQALEEVRAILDAEVGKLRQALDVRETEMEQARATSHNRSAEVKGEEDSLRARCDALKAEAAKHEAAANEATRAREAQKIEHRDEIDRLQAESAQRLIQVDCFQAEGKQRLAEVAALHAEREHRANETVRLRVEKEQHVSEVARLQAERDGQAREIERLRARGAELLSECELQRRERQTSDADHQVALKAVRDNLEREWAEHDALPASFEEELQALDAQYRTLGDELRRSQAVANTALARRRKLEAELTRAQADLQVTHEEKAAVSRELATLRSTFAEKAGQHCQAEARVVELKEDLEALRIASQAAECEIETLLTANRAAQREIEALQIERATILGSTTWRLSALPRRIMTAQRRG